MIIEPVTPVHETANHLQNPDQTPPQKGDKNSSHQETVPRGNDSYTASVSEVSLGDVSAEHAQTLLQTNLMQRDKLPNTITPIKLALQAISASGVLNEEQKSALESAGNILVEYKRSNPTYRRKHSVVVPNAEIDTFIRSAKELNRASQRS